MTGFWSALAFLTRLPLPARVVRGEPSSLPHAVACFPAVGAVVGISLAATAWLAGEVLDFPRPLGASLVVTVWIAVTGGLHLDGLMDTADGLGSRKDAETALAIMRDSRVGAMGVTVGVLALLWKFALVWSLLARPPAEIGAALILTGVWSRWTLALAVTGFPYARAEGLGEAFRQRGRSSAFKTTVLATVLALLPALPAHVLLSPPLAWTLIFPGAALATLGVCGRAWAARLGGLTGDTYGGLNEVAEILGLLAALVVVG